MPTKDSKVALLPTKKLEKRRPLRDIGTLTGGVPRALIVAKAGLKTSEDFRNIMAAFVLDAIEHKVDPDYAQIVTSAGGKLLKMRELECKYSDGKPMKLANL